MTGEAWDDMVVPFSDMIDYMETRRGRLRFRQWSPLLPALSSLVEEDRVAFIALATSSGASASVACWLLEIALDQWVSSNWSLVLE